jgi:diacylglycerol kinase
MSKKFLKSFAYAFEGLKIVWIEEQNFRIQTVISVVVLLVAYFFSFSYIEFVVIIIAISLVLLAEVLNTAIEDVCNTIESGHNLEIKKIKDIIAAGVLVCATASLAIGIFTIGHHFFS